MTWELRRLLPGHLWQAREGRRTIVLDRGAVQFDYPRSWQVEVTTASVAIYDRKPPNAHNRLEVSFFRTPPLDWSGLPVCELIDQATSRPRENACYGPLREEIRGGMELAWRDTWFASPKTGQRACLRACVARRSTVHCLITYEFWGADHSRPDEIWETVLETLVLDRSL